jgi:NosR/NirI family transcriptional regulator, nitrite reductase regulator
MRSNVIVSRLSKVRWMLRIFASLVLMASGASAADLGIARHFFPLDNFSAIEQPQGNPPAAIVRAADGRILGYAFSSYDVSGSVGYAGRPLDIVAVVTPEGIIAGAQIVAHEEPILVIGIPRDALAAYVAEFKGFDISASAGLKQANDLSRGPHAVAGATITSTVIPKRRGGKRCAARPRNPAPVFLAIPARRERRATAAGLPG